MDEKIAMVSFSGGKDSTAMLLKMLELDDPVNYPIHRIVFADTDFEFPEMYAYIKQVQEYINEHYPEKGLKIEHVKSKKSWDEWFFGEITRGPNKGKVRGAPLIVYPCWWAREAKLYPLQRATKECDIKYVGIAIDEKRRISKTAEEDGIRYPLVEWGWTEEDAFKYLDSINMVNPLYIEFNRLGCFHCIKQPTKSWYVLWKKYPELWAIAKEWDEKSLEITKDFAQHGLTSHGSMEKLEERFKDGFVPEGRRPYECNSCDAVSMFHDDEQGIIDTWGEDEDLYQDSALSCEINDPGNSSILEKFKWVKKDEASEPEEWW